MKDQIDILGVSISNQPKRNILEYIFERLKTSQEKTFIITPNPEMLVYAQKHSDYKDKLNSADIALADGIGLSIAARLMAKPIHERITGVDFIEELCKASREKPLSIGFLGGKVGVAEHAAQCLKQKYPWIDVVYASHEWNQQGFKYGKEASNKQLESIEKGNIILAKSQTPVTTIDILFVAFGVPKQEEWISENLPNIPVKAAMGVGGALDFLSGNVRRAPRWMRKMGLEWFFRLVIQPWRWKRQLALIEFIGLVLQQRFASI